MNWYYVRDGKQDGPHSDESLRELARTGVIDSATFVWREGMEDWLPISKAAPHLLPPAGLRLAATPDTTQAQGEPVRVQTSRSGFATNPRSAELARLLKVAKAQRGVILCILLSIACYALIFAVSAPDPDAPFPDGPPLIAIVGVVGLLVVALLEVIYVYRLASALETGIPILWVLGIVFLGCIGLVLLLILSSKATKRLREAGFEVGLLGGNPKDVERRISGG